MQVFINTAHRLSGDKAIDSVCGGPAVTVEDTTNLLNEELDQFAEKYGARFFGKNDGKGPTDDQPRGVEFLVFQIRESARLERERHAKFLAMAKKSQESSGFNKIMREKDIVKFSDGSQQNAMHRFLDDQRQWEKMRDAVDPFDIGL
ncbi:hypothetical protein [Massilia scottii]|uniref:hypothetical protein n=1 Tax=Massilia scottii TaxID=3057166 RepID=UPI0027969437|nr:hypothetical protein [Massilia sp. CCM 9029]MDQ1831593.1 hypothetical protein [Massilia sp. CCM 9029]